MKRIKSIDYLKTVAIIGVLLYHIGFAQNGYLGVEIFFVISGFLMVQGIEKAISENQFNPIKYVLKRIGSFWPLVVLGSLLSMIIGYFVMLPDDYENLAESVIASSFFSNNILQAITTRNYWDIGNTYKPLMHTWYIAVLLQSTIFLAIIIWIASKISKKNGIRNSLVVITIISFLAYCLPVFTDSDKFYLFPFRIFEITLGALIVYLPNMKINPKSFSLIGIVCTFIILFLMFSGINLPGSLSLMIVIISACIILWCKTNVDEGYEINEKLYKVITVSGRYSYDVYIWHQIVIAFLYYSFFQSLNILLILLVFVLTAILSICSAFLRKKIKLLNGTGKRIIISVIIATISCIFSGYVYLHAGVVRDVPELGIEKLNVHRSMHAEYVDVPYSWNKDFEDDNKTHILVLGTSFGRDFANILNESKYADQLEISYIYGADTTKEKDRVSQADYVFYGASTWNIPEELNDIPRDKLYVIGNKSFGNSNGIIYANRNQTWYFEQKVEMSDDMILHNNAWRGIFGDHYIDMISPLLDEHNRMCVFTDDNYYISQDCRHLTKQGAQYYARILDLSFLVKDKL